MGRIFARRLRPLPAPDLSWCSIRAVAVHPTPWLMRPDDLEAIREHFGFAQMDLLGHSYVATVVILYAMRHPEHVRRVVQIGPVQPDAATIYPAHLTNGDGVAAEVFAALGALQQQRASMDPLEFCRKAWQVLGRLYVADAADAGTAAQWGRCDLANERNFMKYWGQYLYPSIQKLTLSPADVAVAKAPVLVIHGRRDRSAPYGGGCDWARMLPDARLVTVDNAAHAPWVEEPESVLSAIGTFLDGQWPPEALSPDSLTRVVAP
jgi:pimeloyl-ACP methyl ester carboxylesterase